MKTPKITPEMFKQVHSEKPNIQRFEGGLVISGISDDRVDEIIKFIEEIYTPLLTEDNTDYVDRVAETDKAAKESILNTMSKSNAKRIPADPPREKRQLPNFTPQVKRFSC